MRGQEIVVIGSGPAGVAAAVQCRRLGVTPLLLDRQGDPGGLARWAFSIENYPGLPPTSGPAFAELLGEHLNRFAISVTRGAVTKITRNTDGYLISGDFGHLCARAVIVAVGTVPNRITGLPGMQHIDYIPRPPAATERDPALVIGGGEAALDYALSLARRGVKTRVLVRGSRPKARGRLLELVAENPLIEIQFNTEVRAIGQEKGAYRADLSTAGSNTTERTSRVVAAVGRFSCAQLLLEELDLGGLETVSTPSRGLYVAGDARSGSLGQIGMAVGDGLAAAMKAVEAIG